MCTYDTAYIMSQIQHIHCSCHTYSWCYICLVTGINWRVTTIKSLPYNINRLDLNQQLWTIILSDAYLRTFVLVLYVHILWQMQHRSCSRVSVKHKLCMIPHNIIMHSTTTKIIIHETTKYSARNHKILLCTTPDNIIMHNTTKYH